MKKKNIKILSWNVNGIRACIKKGFWDWYDEQNADIVCLQETKITEKDFLKLADHHELTPLIEHEDQGDLFAKVSGRKHPIYFALATAEKSGYSGVLTLSKHKPKSVKIGFGKDEFDSEGRTVITEFDDFILVNCYFPNGSRDLSRIPYKMAYSDALLKHLQKLRKKQKNIIITGDFNVAHTEQDIKNAKSNQNNSGFTQIERDWFTKLLNHKYKDSFRELHPNKKDVYTWWSYRPGVRQKNIGWRIDYFVTTDSFLPKIKESFVQMDVMGSDHCPIGIKVKL